jgi:NAD(P)-dependent dehydrogenase (short-subunit alcohol dehydrogenase family)
MSTIIVTGGTSGLGAEISGHLRSFGHVVYNYDLTNGLDVRRPNVDWLLARVPTRLDVLINCAGINRIGWLEDFDPEDWDAVMDTNAKGIFMMTRALLPKLTAARGTVLNIVSNASHMPMTCSAAYNASKGAAHILTQQLARELTKKYGITVFGISPNKLAGTEMSREIEMQVVETRGWTEEEARRYQLNALLTGEETPPERVAEFIAFLLQSKEHHKYLSGCVLPYGA